MAGNLCFFYAIFKKLQCTAGGQWQTNSEHFNPDTTVMSDLAGGFSLRSMTALYGGMFQHLGPNAASYNFNGTNYNDMSYPLPDGVTDPTLNPLWVLLNASIGANNDGQNVPTTVTITPPNQPAQVWPTMPQPTPSQANPMIGSAAMYKDWLSFNPKNGPRLIDKMADWIKAGKLEDSPKGVISFVSLAAAGPAAFPGIPANKQEPILFVASKKGDDGRRTGDGDTMDPGANALDKFWTTGQIFLTDNTGVVQYPAVLPLGTEYYAAVVIGNSGTAGSGRVQASNQKIFVTADALAFGTTDSFSTSLPPLSNLDINDSNASYEQFWLGPKTYDVAGFRYDVTKVFNDLANQLTSHMNTGQLSAQDWLFGHHSCIKVKLTGGEPSPLPFPPQAGKPATPQFDRHLAQRNFKPFGIALAGGNGIHWANAVISQVGAGLNGLSLQHSLPAEAFTVYLGMPTRTFEAYVGEQGLRGWELVRDGRQGPLRKPFPDCVVLRQTGKAQGDGVHLRIADHRREAFLGMSLGIEWQAAKLTRREVPGEIDVIHHGQDGTVAGGFSLWPLVDRSSVVHRIG